MRCFYCGKRVSLVRKRVDADFCSDEHREQYHARTRRNMEALVEDEERMAVTKRLNEGFPLPLPGANQGRNLDDLVIRDSGQALQFTWMPTGLPASRPNLDIHVAPASAFAFHTSEQKAPAPAPLVEPACWNCGRVQEGPRPPQPFTFTILLPQAELLRVSMRQAACDRPRRQNLSDGVELGARALLPAVPRRKLRPAAKSMGTLVRAVRPPAPIQPPPPSPPIVVTLRHPLMAIRLEELHSRLSIHMPVLGMVGINYAPRSIAERPPALPSFELIVRSDLAIQFMRIGPGGMQFAREPKGMHRFVPNPEGFHRKQYYSWELLERLCGLGFDTIANHRPEIRIAAAPQRVPQIGMARLWAAAVNDATTAQAEPRRPAPPFREKLALPGRVGMRVAGDLRTAAGRAVGVRALNAGEQVKQMRQWQSFTVFGPALGQTVSTAISPAAWVSRTGDALGIPAWARPQTRGGKRMVSHANIATRQPAFSGPAFAAGSRQAGPAPEKRLEPPAFEPKPAHPRSEQVAARGSTVLPSLPGREVHLEQGGILPGGCQMPIGETSTRAVSHPAHAILIDVAPPPGHLNPTAAAGLDTYPPARWTGARLDMAKGKPQAAEREVLDRFRKRGYDGLRSGYTVPGWPTGSNPGLVKPTWNQAVPHPAREPGYEGAATMYRAWDQPALRAYQGSCGLMDWGTLVPMAPGLADWGRESLPTGVPLAVPVVLPLDPHGPIRDWGLGPLAEPEKPPEPIHEDFALGLANWICSANDWRQDIAGVRTGSLALLSPSLLMFDYELEFLCKIEKQSIGWVYRAGNTANYHAVRIVVDAEGAVRLDRFSVLGGEREAAVSESLAVSVARNSSCRVKMAIRGDDFEIFLNDKPAAKWSDDRLSDGGIGFFSEPDDHARLYWVKVTPYSEGPAEELYTAMAPLRSDLHREIRMGV